MNTSLIRNEKEWNNGSSRVNDIYTLTLNLIKIKQIIISIERLYFYDFVLVLT